MIYVEVGLSHQKSHPRWKPAVELFVVGLQCSCLKQKAPNMRLSAGGDEGPGEPLHTAASPGHTQPCRQAPGQLQLRPITLLLPSLTCFFGLPASLPGVKMGQTKGGKRASCIREGESTWSSPEFGRGLGCSCSLPKISISCSRPEAAVAPFLPAIHNCGAAPSPTSGAADRIKEKSRVQVMGRGKTEADRPPKRKW